jgi:NAD(P)-dependent dehydrogenase (short-subunit alcohol dehydrogenase family)
VGICEGRVCIVTGAGRGIGREHALMLAAHGAKVVVNDIGGEVDGSGRSTGPAHDVVAEIQAAGGDAVVNGDDISTWDGSQRVDRSSCGCVRSPRCGDQQRRHPARPHAGQHDRGRVGRGDRRAPEGHVRSVAPCRCLLARADQGRRDVDGRIINTSSPSGIYGNVGQTNYGAAKAGIAAFTVIAAKELARYGVTVNAIAPAALTRMTENLGMGKADDMTKAMLSPRWIAPIVTWLASSASRPA